jgi:hypothetical protein
MTPDDASRADPLRPVIDAVADADWAQARDILLDTAATIIRADGHDGQLHKWACRKCDFIRRYEDMQPPARVMDAYRARFGDLGGGTA